MSEWINGAPSDPKDGDRILAWDGERAEVAEWDGGTQAWWVLVEYTMTPKAWLPLPPPPTPIKESKS